MNFKKGDKVYVVADGKVHEETASRDFWQSDVPIFKRKDDALQHVLVSQKSRVARHKRNSVAQR